MLSKVEFTKKLAKRVKELRLIKKLSQEQLAHDAELYRTYVNHIESGRYAPSGYVIYKLAHALRVKPADLLSF